MWWDEPWPMSRPWPTDWTENTVQSRGMAYDPQQTIASGFAMGAVITIGCAAVVAGGMLAAAKWFGGAR